MAPAPQPRAYTMRLAAADPQVKDWSRPLWLTHEAINRGTQAFGNWLLSFRGGICHRWADKEGASAEEKAQRWLLFARSM